MRALAIILGFTALPARGSPEAAVSKQYPNQAVAASCAGEFLGRAGESAVVVHDKAKKLYRVLWVSKAGSIQELDAVAGDAAAKTFELQCFDAKKAADHKKVAETSESIHSTLAFPKGSGILCYFADSVTAKCWTATTKQKKLVPAGGWQT